MRTGHFGYANPGLLMSRRDLLRNTTLFGAGAALAGGTGLASGASAAEPRHGGILTCWTSGDPPNFDPFSNTSSYVLHTVAACYNSLIMYDPLNPEKIIGDLAQSWELSDDGKVYTFKLIRNAKFHDGKPLTAADVKHTFDIVRQPPQGVTSARKSLLAAVSSIETPDDYTVKFILSRPSPALISSLATGWFVVAPKHILEAKGTMKDDVIGSGPFMLKTYKRGVSVELVRNPNYHVPDRPFLDGMTYYIIPDPATAYAYLRTGQILFYDGLSGKDARKAEAELAGKVVVHRNASYIGDPYTVNTRRKPFDDIRVRKALALSVDHAESVKVVNDGDGVVAGFLPRSPWGLPAEELAKVPGYWPDIEASRAEARKLLVEAGFPNGFDTTLTTRKGAGTHDARGVFLADQFARIGVRAKLNVQESAVYFETMKAANFDIGTNVISSLANDPDFLMGDFHTCNGGLNYAGLCSAKVDELFVQQSGTVDVEERRRITHALELAALNEFATVVLYFKNKFVATSHRVQNYVMPPEPDNNRRMQEVWLSA